MSPREKVRIGIDASGIDSGGGITHLVGLVSAADPDRDGFSTVEAWCGKNAFNAIPERPWLRKHLVPELDQIKTRYRWQKQTLPGLFKERCDVLLVPGSTFVGPVRPYVAISQNVLPFDEQELRRYGITKKTLRLRLLRFYQARTFHRANGMIFLTEFAKNFISGVIGKITCPTAVVAHGLAPEFRMPPRPQKPISEYSIDNPLRIVYVSVVTTYKHHWNVIRAVQQLQAKGYPVSLEICGGVDEQLPSSYRADYESLLEAAKDKKPPIVTLGKVPWASLAPILHRSDIGVFASSCENLPCILLEKMAAGLPVATSERGPMREVLGDSGAYFNAYDPNDIARALESMILNPAERERMARESFEKAEAYTWERCAHETFSFLNDVYTQRTR